MRPAETTTPIFCECTFGGRRDLALGILVLAKVEVAVHIARVGRKAMVSGVKVCRCGGASGGRVVD